MKEHERYGSCGECGVELSETFAALSDDGWKQRCEELEVAAAALYLGHDDGRELFEMYKSVYLPEPAKGRDV